jgi:hypothetical protein
VLEGVLNKSNAREALKAGARDVEEDDGAERGLLEIEAV